jgi:D-lyxose ketol-isomerase
LYLRAQDKNATNAGFAKAGLTTFKYVLNGSLTISDSVTLSKKTVALKDNEITVAKFTLKPSKADSVKLDNLIFDFTNLGTVASTRTNADNNITVTVDGTEVDLWNEHSKFDDTITDYTYSQAKAIYNAADVADVTEEVEVEVKVK